MDKNTWLLKRNSEFMAHILASVGEIETLKILSRVAKCEARSMWNCAGIDFRFRAAQLLAASHAIQDLTGNLPAHESETNNSLRELEAELGPGNPRI